MILEWFKAGEAAEFAEALADQFASRTGSSGPATAGNAITANSASTDLFDEVLERAEPEVRRLRLNFYKKARFANSFKWRLIEKGVQRETADEVTQRLVLHLSANRMGPSRSDGTDAVATPQQSSKNARSLLNQAQKCMAQGAYARAVGLLEEFLRLDPRSAEVLNDLGAALSRLGRFAEVEVLAPEDRRAEAEQAVAALAAKLNLSKVERRSYLGLVLAARAAEAAS